MKKKILKGPKLQKLFEEDAELMEKALKSMTEAVSAFCSGKESKQYVDETIRIEKQQDKLRQDILDHLFRRETMVFSRPDRLKIVKSMDNVVDKSESIVRKLVMHTPKPQKDLIEGINWMAEQNSQIGTHLKELIIAIFKDFSLGKNLIKKINDIRRNIRKKEYELLEKLFDINPNYADFRYFEIIIEYLTALANVCEDFADDIYGLICKYTLG